MRVIYCNHNSVGYKRPLSTSMSVAVDSYDKHACYKRRIGYFGNDLKSCKTVTGNCDKPTNSTTYSEIYIKALIHKKQQLQAQLQLSSCSYSLCYHMRQQTANI